MKDSKLFDIVQARVKEHGGLRAAARAIGISAPYLCRLRQGEHQPSEETLKKLKASKVVEYVQD